MKINIFKFITAVSLFFIVTSCEKGNLYYETYENSVKSYDQDSYSYLKQNRVVFDSLLLVLDRLYPLQDSISADSVTLFAATNKSFEIAIQNLNLKRKVNKLPPQYLDDIPLADLDSLMCRYIFNGNLTTANLSDLKDGSYQHAIKHNYRMHVQFKKLNASGYVNGGQQQIVFTDPNNSIFQRYWESTSTNTVNIKTKNGVIHILSPGHNFGFNKIGSVNL